MSDYLTEYFRSPERYSPCTLKGLPSNSSGYFRFRDCTLYGRCPGHRLYDSPLTGLPDVVSEAIMENGRIFLPFDVAEIVDNLRYERYRHGLSDPNSGIRSAINHMYYGLRPLFPVWVRKHLQQLYLKGWEQIAFPVWPVDRTVDALFEYLLLLSMRAADVDRVPFIWFWPEGAPSCAMMTHDVETREGRDLCASVMDIDDSFGIKASFQVVPEERYEVTPSFLKSITNRGFGLAVQDLNHDGHLYTNRRQFIARARKINSYRRQWGVEGFRSAILYRNQEWFDDLEFSYDMSIPNVAHLDPQRGGCCTVMPYFIGKMLELPVTATQDYTMFHVLGDYSLDLWKRQMGLIMEKNGLMSFIVHPDYLTTPREITVYKALLGELVRLREEQGVWVATPDEISRWWRQRAEMRVVKEGDAFRIEGPGSERARLAYASEKDGRLVLALESMSPERAIFQP